MQIFSDSGRKGSCEEDQKRAINLTVFVRADSCSMVWDGREFCWFGGLFV